jgi:DNA-binding NtrC family response regulator
MVVVTRTNVLTVGITEKIHALRELPIRLIALRFGTEAVRSFKSKRIDTVISRWNLADMKDGELLKGIKEIKPDMPTIAIIEEGNVEQEIAARSTGISAVVTEGFEAEHLGELICEILGIEAASRMDPGYALEKNIEDAETT